MTRKLRVIIVGVLVLLWIGNVNILAQLSVSDSGKKATEMTSHTLMLSNALRSQNRRIGTRVSQISRNMDVVGQIGGVMHTIFVTGRYGYVGVGPRLIVIDISNPSALQVLGRSGVLRNIVQDIAVSGKFAYVVMGKDGLQVINVSDPYMPRAEGVYDTPGFAWGVEVAGNYVYVADGTAGVRVVDVSDPASPREVGAYDTPGDARDVEVAGDYVYVADGTAGVRVIDATNPMLLHEVGVYDVSATLTPAYGLAISGDYAFVAFRYIYSPVAESGVRVLKISDVSNISQESIYNMPGILRDVVVFSGYSYLSTGSRGLLVVDVTDPSRPQEIGSYTPLGYARDVVVSGVYAYVMSDGGMYIIDISSPDYPQEIGIYKSQAPVIGGTVSGHYAYIGVGMGGMDIVDVSNASQPKKIGDYFSTLSQGFVDIALQNSRAYLAAQSGGLHIINVSNPSNPTMLGHYVAAGNVNSVSVYDNYAYIIEDPYFDASKFHFVGGGMRIVNVSDPVNTNSVGFFDSPGNPQDVEVFNNYAYIADCEAGMRALSISNPAYPIEVGFYDTPGCAEDVSVYRGYLGIADGESGIWIVDVITPNYPNAVAHYDTCGYAKSVVISSTVAYVADGEGGFLIITWSIPEDIVYDGQVNIQDVQAIVDQWHKQEGDMGWSSHFDIDGDGKVTVLDILRVTASLGRTYK